MKNNKTKITRFSRFKTKITRFFGYSLTILVACLLIWIIGSSRSYDEHIVKDEGIIQNVALKMERFIADNFNETTGVILHHYDLDVVLNVKGNRVNVIITQSENSKTPTHGWMHKIRIWFRYSRHSGRLLEGAFEVKKWSFGSENSEEIINKKKFGHGVQGKKLKSFCHGLMTDILEPWMQKKQRGLII